MKGSKRDGGGWARWVVNLRKDAAPAVWVVGLRAGALCAFAAVAPTMVAVTSDAWAEPPQAPSPISSRVLLADSWPAVSSPPSEASPTAAGRARALARAGGRRPYHPAPRIVIDAAASSPAGAEWAALLQRTARNLAYWPVRRCYEDGLRRDPNLSGRITLAFDPSVGAEDRASVESSTLSDTLVGACVAREIGRVAVLAQASFATPTSVSVDVALRTGDEFVPTGPRLPGDARLREALRASWPAAAECYARGLDRDPRLGGFLELRLRVTASGGVLDLTEGSTHFPDTEVTRCVLGLYRSATLPPADAERAFVYALHFERSPRRGSEDSRGEPALEPLTSSTQRR